MPQDRNTAKFVAEITVNLVPVNRYGDELADNGTFTYTRVIEVKTIANLGMVLERLSETGLNPIPNDAHMPDAPYAKEL